MSSLPKNTTVVPFHLGYIAAHYAGKDKNYTFSLPFQQNQSRDVRIWEVERPSSVQFKLKELCF